MDVDNTGKSKERQEQGSQSRQGQRQDQQQRQEENLATTKNAMCEGVMSHETVGHGHDKMVNVVEVEDPNAEPDKECVYTIDHEVNVVNLSQSGEVKK